MAAMMNMRLWRYFSRILLWWLLLWLLWLAVMVIVMVIVMAVACPLSSLVWLFYTDSTA